jgi:hypothetical protein
LKNSLDQFGRHPGIDSNAGLNKLAQRVFQ